MSPRRDLDRLTDMRDALKDIKALTAEVNEVEAGLSSRPDRRPVQLLTQRLRPQIDESAVLDRPVLTALELKPADRALPRVNDQHLLHIVRGVERQLLPGLIAGGDNLEYEGGRRIPRDERRNAVQSAVWHAEVIFTIAEVELPASVQTGTLCKRPEQLGELPFNRAVWAGRGGNHVVDTLPDLIQAIKARAAATLQQLVEPGCWRIHDQRSHTSKGYQRPSAHPAE